MQLRRAYSITSFAICGWIGLCMMVGACRTQTKTTAADANTTKQAAAPVPGGIEGKSLPLPGAKGPVGLDYLQYDAGQNRVWIPAAGTGSVDVIDCTTLAMTRIEGFDTVEREIRGQKMIVGPTAVAVGDGAVFIGSRVGAICTVDASTLKKESCIAASNTPELASAAPDGLAYVHATKELWMTAGGPPGGGKGKEEALFVFDASDPRALKPKDKIAIGGEGEGYAVDEGRGIFYTNLEDKDRTLVIDVKTHKIVATWNPGCGEKGPRGIALDRARHLVFVACTDHIAVLDGEHDGTLLATLETGDGVDNIDYVEPRAELFVAAGKAAKLTIARVADGGALLPIDTVQTPAGARVVVADAKGSAYVIDPKGGAIVAYPR
jgi:DNA-binding beta-propeller fold protein YncE